MDSETDVRIKKLIGQQLPDLDKLKMLAEYVYYIRDIALRKQVGLSGLDQKKLDSAVQELKAKLNELLETPYHVELLLLILPTLIEAKKTF